MTLDLLSSVRAVLEASGTPMKPSEIRKALSGMEKLPSQKTFGSALRKVLEAQPEYPGIKIWPKHGASSVYCARDLGEVLAESFLEALNQGPLTIAQAAKAVSKSLRVLSVARAYTELKIVAREMALANRIHQISPNRQVVMYLSYAWAAKLVAEPISSSIPKDPIGQLLPGILERLQPGQGNYVRVDHLRNTPELRGFVDRAVIQLADAGLLALAAYDGPRSIPDEEKWNYVEDGRGELYIGIALRERSTN